MSLDELISKEELLAGMPAKRTKTLLFLIEKHTAVLTARSRVEFSLTDLGEIDRDLAFFQGFALDDRKMPHPTIQQLERFASQWSVLVPQSPQLKAALFHALAQKYGFTELIVPQICQAICCQESAVREAYEKLYHQPLVSAFESKIPLVDKYHWMMLAIALRLESLPPFWLATLVTVALGLPQAFLALPIAVAELGSLVTVLWLIILGGINILTTICMAEAIGRSRDFRCGRTFIKQLAANYLGKAGSLVLAIAVSIRVFLIALACYLGLSATMANITAVPATIWAGLLFLLGLYVLSRQSLNLTVGVTILLAVINVSVLLLFSLLCFDRWHLDNLLYVNWSLLQGHSFQPQILDRVLGVTLMLFFGHVYVGECAKIVLPKDPSANSLIGGTIAGTACLTLLFCLWVVAVNGAIAPEILASQTGTVIEPLIEKIGSSSQFLGAILAVSLLGMAWLRSSSLLVNLCKEWIPASEASRVTLTRQQGRLILQTRDRYDTGLIGITYLKFGGERLTLRLDLQWQGKVYRQDIEISQRWSIKALFARYPQLKGIDLDLEIQSANRDRLCLKVLSSLAISYQGDWEKTTVATKITRRSEDQSQIWTQIWAYLLEKRRFILSIVPLGLVFLLTEGLFLAGKESFTSVMGFAGVLGNSLVGGIFPVLLLISSRRKGELLTGRVFQLLNSPWLLGSIYAFSLLVLLSHGLFIWENTFARLSALSVTLLSLVATLVMLLTGAFIPRTVIEFQQEESEPSLLKITTGGKPKTTRVKLGYVDGEQNYQTDSIKIPSLASLRYAIFQLSGKQLAELQVWLPGSESQNDSVNSPEFLEIYQENNKMQFDLKLFGGKILLPLTSQQCWCKLEFSAAKETI